MPAFDLIEVGTTANDGTGDPARTAFQKINTLIDAINDGFVDDLISAGTRDAFFAILGTDPEVRAAIGAEASGAGATAAAAAVTTHESALDPHPQYLTATEGVTVTGDQDIGGLKRFTGTGATKVPVGTVVQRPSGEDGLIRYNSDDDTFEGYGDGGWGPIGGGTAGIVRESFTATAAQTVFPVTGGYTPNAIDVFMNGIRLEAGDVTISSGVNVVLASGAEAGDVIEVSGYQSVATLANINLRVYHRAVATAAQTSFPVTGGYTVGFIDVYKNGIQLDPSEDFTATDGANVVLASGAAAGAVIIAVGYKQLVAISEFLFGNTGLKAYDTDSSHALTIAPGSNLTANRTLTVTTGDADKTLDLTTTDADVRARASANKVVTCATLAGRAIFSARKSADQTSISGTSKVTFDTEDTDVGAHYDTTNSRWTPPAGPVKITAHVYFTLATASSNTNILIYKNGSLLKGAISPNTAAGVVGALISIIDVANGTDYYEVWVTPSGTPTAVANVNFTYFQGEQI